MKKPELLMYLFCSLFSVAAVADHHVHGPKGEEVVYDSDDQVIRDANTGKLLAECKTNRDDCKKLLEGGANALKKDDNKGNDK